MSDPEQSWAGRSLDLTFGDPHLLRQALTHKSVGADNYERLEFLGDRVLGVVIAEWLVATFPEEHEGKLTRRFHQLVSRESCAAVARKIDVPAVLRLGAQARADGGSDSDNILGDVMEALVGACYLDLGMEATRALIHRLWDGATSAADVPKHPKMRLQEWAAAQNLKAPHYRLVSRHGPQHSPRFEVELEIASFPPVVAEGGSKQDAETEAARRFLDAHAL